MIDRLFEYIAPHYCILCHKIGTVLCLECKNNIAQQALVYCPSCHTDLINNLCPRCPTPVNYFGAFYQRDDTMKLIIDHYKFYKVRPLSRILAELLHDRLPYFPGEVIYVNIPTARKHVRERGFDHLDLILQNFSQLRGVNYRPILERKGNLRQVGAKKLARKSQAEESFFCNEELGAETTYVIVDDIVTTGATLEAAARALHKAGARKVAVTAIAYQPSI